MLLELEQRLPRHHLDDAAEYIGRMPVVPQRSRLFGQRQLCQAVGKLSIVEIGFEQTGIRVELPHRAVAVEAIGDARGVAQQVLDGDRTVERLELQPGLPSSPGFSTPTLVSANAGMYFERGSSSLSLPSSTSIIAATEVIGFDIEYRRKMVSAAHRNFGGDVAQAKTLEINRVAVLLDQNDGAGNLALSDLVAEIIADPRQLLRREVRRNPIRRSLRVRRQPVPP